MHTTPDLLTLLRHIPTFVWIILIFILVMGRRQSRPQAMSRTRLWMLPAAWLCFGAWGVSSSFGGSGAALLAWAAGVAIGAVLVRATGWPRGARFDSAAGHFLVPGSWWPLAVMLGIFCSRFAVGMSLSLHPALAQQTLFADGFSLLFGVFGGLFLGRALTVLRSGSSREASAALA
ncbi:DUF6622 family protein [Roseateles amylovorans]|uniref:DUF1453 domain-containing protein n=1 Tax=Roseateles amylovorans TaxID=2978473 RepID=A0ABY6B3X2_9BURK|nr:DUF6622 family protein [Roseateles amylovorans]UXH79885.1 hypothetical protein N4261_08390 [Roseateles amylovorans]